MRLKPVKDDRAHLHDMPESAKQAVSYDHGLTFEQYWDDPKTRDAIAMRLTIIGEAAARVSAASVLANPQVPFEEMRGLRNRIAHTYDKVDFTEDWKITQQDLKPLISELERSLRQLEKAAQAAIKIQQASHQTVAQPRPGTGPRMGI